MTRDGTQPPARAPGSAHSDDAARARAEGGGAGDGRAPTGAQDGAARRFGRRRRPLRVGVTASAKGGRWMWWLSWLGLRLMGLRPQRLTAPLPADVDLDAFDGFLIGGGDDIGADLYGAKPLFDVRIDEARDAMEMRVLDNALPRDVPVLGICRGAQMLNIHRGGNIHQEVREAFLDVPRMWTPLPVKTVTTEPGVRLREVIGRETFRVNSLHHQAVDRLGEGLRVAARDEWGVVQAVEDPQAHFRFGVQWHPEFLLWRRPHRRLFRAFAAAIHGAGPAAQRRAARNEPEPEAEAAAGR